MVAITYCTKANTVKEENSCLQWSVTESDTSWSKFNYRFSDVTQNVYNQ